MKTLFPPPRAALVGAASLTALSLAFSAPAEAVIVNVNGTNYDISTFNSNYTDDTSRFSTTEMPWWGNANLAEQFAIALGGPNYGGLPGNQSGDQGPYFAYSTFMGEGILMNVYTYDVNAIDGGRVLPVTIGVGSLN